MPWNYRIFHTRYQPPNGEQEDHFTIRRVFYRATGEIESITAAGSMLGDSTRTALLKDHARMHEAFAKPVLSPADVPGYVYDELEVPMDTAAADKGAS